MSKTALVTGASRGIGKAVARALAGDGYTLYLTCLHSLEELQQEALQLKAAYGVSCFPFQTDMGDYDAVLALFDRIPRLDVLVNNAGISHIGLLQDMTQAEWRRVFAVNIDAVFYTCKCAVPRMLSAGSGRIVNISSVWGNVGASMETAYSASKGAVNSFTRALAKELAPSGIPVNAVACGCIDTDMNRNLTPAERKALTAEIPADRMGTPEEAAQLVLQLCSAPVYLTGQVLTLDGGWT